ncbi:MAG: hypothetical protein CMJ78_19010 [Planctomycetaceae bacterium]|nr:hypothetical protein [Planctomycetaceae bacterium]
MEFVFEILFELAIRTPGYFILRTLRPGKDVKLEDHGPIGVGILFWIVVGRTIWGVVHFL